jgi:cell wall-associated NlpC family hydrolase
VTLIAGLLSAALCCQLTITTASASSKTPPGKSTSSGKPASGKPTKGKPATGKPASSTTSTTTSSTTSTTTLPPVPPAAEPLLTRLLGTAGNINADNQAAARLSEQYDEAKLKAFASDLQVLTAHKTVEAANTVMERAGRALRRAAIDAYVTGSTTSVSSSLLTNSLSNGGMVSVYASVAVHHVRQAVDRYSAAVRVSRAVSAAADRANLALNRWVALIGGLRARAVELETDAAASAAAIKARLLSLVGAAEFQRLTSPMPVGSPYRGPNLAGSSLGKVATPLQAFAAIVAAKKLVGVPYVWGGASKKGVDCSGLVMLGWAAAGITLEHSATAQWQESEPVPLAQLQPGDLLFYHFAHDGKTAITHVVMYIGSGPFGRATILQAAQAGTAVAYAALYLGGLVSAGRP